MSRWKLHNILNSSPIIFCSNRSSETQFSSHYFLSSRRLFLPFHFFIRISGYCYNFRFPINIWTLSFSARSCNICSIFKQNIHSVLLPQIENHGCLFIQWKYFSESKTKQTSLTLFELKRKKTDWLSCSPFESTPGFLSCYLTGNCIYISQHLIWNLFS